MGEILGQAGVMALASMFVGVLPLTMGIVYAIWPTEQRLALMRTLSLATVFAAIGGTALGLINLMRYVGNVETPAFSRGVAVGLAESLITLFLGFGCLTVGWLGVTIGMWRKT